MAHAHPQDQPLASLQECTDWVLSGCKPREKFRIGTEYERLALGPDGRPLPYEGPVGIRTLLDRLAARHGWKPYLENGNPIALFRHGASVSLEPAGQFELSGHPCRTVADMRQELAQHTAEVRDVAEELGVRLAYVGLNPVTSLAEVPHMPKGRYKIMRAYMPQVGTLGLHMMHLTCTVQTNVDFSSPDEAMEMMRLGHLLSPVLLALFANSPYLEGKDTGYATFRGHIWTDVDRARCDVSRFAFDKAATVQDYVDWALDVPMYFLDVHHPDGTHGYRGLDGKLTFRQFFDQGLGGLDPSQAGRRPTLADWELHASTVFPDIRLKRYVEIRQADIVPPEALPALPALTKGLFYDVTARKAALNLLQDGDLRIDRAALREAACKDALEAVDQGLSVRELSAEVLKIARQGLQRLAAASHTDLDAVDTLQPLEAIVAGERPPFYQVVREKLQQGGGLLALAEPW